MLQGLLLAPHDRHEYAAVPGGVRATHVHTVLASLKSISAGERSKELIGGEGAAFHAIMYHLAGGADAELKPPPCRQADKQFSANLLKAARGRFGDAWRSKRSRLQRSGNSSEFERHRLNELYDLASLALDEEARAAAMQRRAVTAAPGGSGPAPDPATLERSASSTTCWSTQSTRRAEDISLVQHVFCDVCPKQRTYLEIGALDGLKYSNTVLLERGYNWGGLLIEGLPQNAVPTPHGRRQRPRRHRRLRVRTQAAPARHQTRTGQKHPLAHGFLKVCA